MCHLNRFREIEAPFECPVCDSLVERIPLRGWLAFVAANSKHVVFDRDIEILSIEASYCQSDRVMTFTKC